VQFDSFLTGKPAARPPLVPLLGGLAARAGGTTYRQMSGDAGAWTACLTKAAALFAVDALVVGADPSLSIEAVGAPLAWQDDEPRAGRFGGSPATAIPAGGRLAAAVETTSRLFSVMRPRLGCVAAMAGPWLLAGQAFGADGAAAGVAALRPFQVALVEALCKSAPHVLLFLETGGLTAVGPAERRAYNTLLNVARHYNVATAVLIDAGRPELLAGVAALGTDFVLLDADPGAAALGALAGAVRGVGFPAFTADGRLAASTAAALAAKTNLLLTSAQPLAAGVDIRTLRAAMDSLRGE